MAGNARERVNDVCKKLMQTRKQPKGEYTLKKFVADLCRKKELSVLFMSSANCDRF